MINRSVCTIVTSVFTINVRKGHFLSYAEAKSIMKRLLSNQYKEKTNQSLKTFEHTASNRITNFGKLTFFSCFYVIAYNSVSDRYILNQIRVYSCLVPTNMLTSTFLKENSSRLKSISQTSKSNVISISLSRCTTVQQLNSLIHCEIVYNLSLLFSFGI